MDIVLLEPSGHFARFNFDANSPKIGSTSVLSKSKGRFCPPSREALDDMLRENVEGSFESKHAYVRLAAIAKMLDAGEVGLAAIATCQLRLRKMPASDLEVAGLRKAGVDDKAPGWPAGTSGSRGGKFRPKDAAVAFDPAYEAERMARRERLKARRGVRAVLRRVLTAKRLARLGLELAGEAVPGLEALDTASLIEDLAELSAEMAEENAEVEEGRRALEELTMSSEEESFSSFEAFKKGDLEKRFGEAGDGFDYHHIVEQASGASQAELQSTSNIVRIPKLLHEEINAEVMKSGQASRNKPSRAFGRESWEVRRAAGLAILRKVGILYP